MCFCYTLHTLKITFHLGCFNITFYISSILLFTIVFQVIIACLAAVAVAAPSYSYDAPPADSSEEVEVVPILKDDRVHEEDGTYSFDFEAGNGISFSQSGSPDGDDDAVIKAGEYS